MRNVLSPFLKPLPHRRLYTVPDLSQSSPRQEWKVINLQSSWKKCHALPCQQPSSETTAHQSCSLNSSTHEGTAPSSHVVSLNRNVLQQLENPARQIFHFTFSLPKEPHYCGARLYHQVKSQGERGGRKFQRKNPFCRHSWRGKVVFLKIHLCNEVTEPS